MSLFSSIINTAKNLYESTVGKAADTVYKYVSSAPKQTASISQQLPQPAPTVFGYQGQPAAVQPSQPTQNYTPAPKSNIVNPSPSQNYSQQPNVSTIYGEGYADPNTGKITLTNPNPALPGGFSSTITQPVPYQEPTPAPAPTPEPTSTQSALPLSFTPYLYSPEPPTPVPLMSPPPSGGFASGAFQTFDAPNATTIHGSPTDTLGLNIPLTMSSWVKDAELPSSDSVKKRKTVAIDTTMNRPVGSSYDPFSMGGIVQPEAGLTPAQAETYSNQFLQPINSPTIPAPTAPTGSELLPPSGATGTGTGKVGTASDFNKNITTRTSGAISTINTLDTQIANKQASDSALKYLSTNSQKIFGVQLGPEDVQNMVNGYPDRVINTDLGPMSVSNTYQTLIQNYKQGNTDPITGRQYTAENYQLGYSGPQSDLQKQAADLQTQITALTKQDPFLGKTIEQTRTDLMNKYELPSLRAQRDKKQEEVDAILHTYETIAGEIKDDPDFSKSLKANRLQYLNTQQDIAVKSYQRDLDRLNTQIQDAEKNVNTAMTDTLNNYQIYQTKVNALNTAYDKLQNRIDKEADNARAAINTLISNPDLAKEITDTEIAYIQKNGTYPTSLIKKIGSAVNEKLQSIFRTNVGTNQVQTWGVTADNQIIAIGEPMTDINTTNTSGVNAPLPATFQTDMESTLNAIAQIQGNATLSNADKNARINIAISRLQSQYATNANAQQIITGRFGSTSAVNTQNQQMSDEAQTAEFNTALQAGIDAVKNKPWYKTEKGIAQDQENQLIAKYGSNPSLRAAISSTFAKYYK